jgi:5'-3' exonuclease
MGVPSFFRWLTNKYPTVVVKASEDEGECINTSLPNPNGIEFDNLYLDMNAIIHFCFQPDDQVRSFFALVYYI